MAKNLKKTSAASTVTSQQEDHLWELARQIYYKGWVEIANPVCVPEQLHVFRKDSRVPLLAIRPKNQTHRFTLVIVLKGAGQMCVDEQIFRLDAGHVFLIFPFQFRHYISLQESSIRWIYITFEMSRTDSLESLRNHPWNLTPESTQILRQLLEAVSSRNLKRMTRGAEAQFCLALLLRQSSAQEMTPPSSSSTIPKEAQKLLERIHGFLYRHIDQPFKLEDMARGIGCSKSHLYHQFKEHFKINLGHYVAQVRLNKAAGLLYENSLNISSVAQACGYSSVYTFSRKFRAVMGCSPRNYRIQFRKGNTGR